MLHINVCRALRGSVAYVILFLFRLSSSLLQAAVYPYVVVAICSALYYNSNGGSGGGDFGPTADGGEDIFSNTSYNGSDAACYVPGALPDQAETRVHRYAVAAMLACQVLLDAPSVVFGLFCGAWSDTRGRKLPMMAPCVGLCLSAGFYLASVHVSGMKVALWLAAALTKGMFGSAQFLSKAAICHMIDTNDRDQRTEHLGRVLAISLLGKVLGSALAGVLQDVFSMTTSMAVPVGVSVICMLTVRFGLPEAVDTRKKGEEKNRKRHALFSWAGLKDSIMTVAKPRGKHVRSVILVSLSCSAVGQSLARGQGILTVLFVKQPPLSWPSSRYGYLVAVSFGAMGFCLLFVLPLLSQVLRVSDVNVVLIALVFRLVPVVWLGFCTETWMVFAAVISGGMGGVIDPGLQSVSSKAVGDDEVGKLLFVQASLDTLFTLVGSGIFTGIYAATVHVRPGTAFLAMAAVCLALLLLTLWMRRLIKEGEALDMTVAYDRQAADDGETASLLLDDETITRNGTTYSSVST